MNNRPLKTLVVLYCSHVQYVIEDARDLTKKLLCMDPAQRITLSEVGCSSSLAVDKALVTPPQNVY